MALKTFTLYKILTVEVVRTIDAEGFREAFEKLNLLQPDRFVKAAPGAEIVVAYDAGGDAIHEER
jgi:hypothetical protein